MKDEAKPPYRAWVLLPSYRPTEVLITEQWKCLGKPYVQEEKGKHHRQDAVYSTRADAIAAGRASLAAQQAALDKKQANIIKRLATLDTEEKKC